MLHHVLNSQMDKSKIHCIESTDKELLISSMVTLINCFSDIEQLHPEKVLTEEQYWAKFCCHEVLFELAHCGLHTNKVSSELLWKCLHVATRSYRSVEICDEDIYAHNAIIAQGIDTDHAIIARMLYRLKTMVFALDPRNSALTELHDDTVIPNRCHAII